MLALGDGRLFHSAVSFFVVIRNTCNTSRIQKRTMRFVYSIYSLIYKIHHFIYHHLICGHMVARAAVAMLHYYKETPEDTKCSPFEMLQNLQS